MLLVVVIGTLAAGTAAAQGGSGNPSGPSAGGAGAGHMISGLGTEEVRTDLDWAQVRYVVARRSADGTWRFDVTIEHRDEGWDHYADLWQVVHPDTLEVYGERVLLHPHDTEQPFTRSLSGIRIPDGRTTVLVRATCTRHGYEGRAILVDLTVDEGELFETRS